MSSKFNKTYNNPNQIIQILQARGLSVKDEKKAVSFVKRVGYYRLSAYCYPFLKMPKEDQLFRTGVAFENILSIYFFDRKLRILVFNEVEKIEVAVRSAIANIMSEESNDPFWMTNPMYYADPNKFSSTKALIDKEYMRSKEDFIEHFRKKYVEPYPPAWILVEILPFGLLTRIYENINNFKARKRIAQEFDLNVPVFLSWITVIANTRNTCCHHARLWNRSFALRTLTVKHPNRPWLNSSIDQHRFFYNLSIIKWFVDVIAPDNDLKVHVKDLLAKYPMIDTNAMGFPRENWELEPIWLK